MHAYTVHKLSRDDVRLLAYDARSAKFPLLLRMYDCHLTHVPCADCIMPCADCIKVFGRHTPSTRTVSGAYASEFGEDEELTKVIKAVDAFVAQEGRRPRILVAKVMHDITCLAKLTAFVRWDRTDTTADRK